MTNNYKLIIFSLLFLSGAFVQAQQGNPVKERDFESWTSASMQLNLSKKWNLNLEGQLRLDEKSTEIKKYFTEFTAGYNLNKQVEFAAGLRYNIKNDNQGKIQGNEYALRYQFDASFKHDLRKLEMQYRLRYTNNNELGLSPDDNTSPEQFLRLKVGMEYGIKNWKLDPEFSGELFQNLENPLLSKSTNQYRLTFGTSYNLKRYGKIGLYYRYEREFNSENIAITDIIQLKYKYTFDL